MKINRLIESISRNGFKTTIKKIINIRMQKNFLKYYYNRKKIPKAIKIGEKLVRHFPDDLYNYQKLARAYLKNNEYVKAIKTLKKGLYSIYDIDFEAIVHIIEEHLSNGKWSINSQFIFKGGHQNYGLIEHTLNENSYLTKIIPTKGAKGEVIIKNLQLKYEKLNEVTPTIENILVVMDICFITMKKIDGSFPQKLTNDFIEKVIELNNSITSVRYNDDLVKIINESSSYQNHFPSNRHELLKMFYFTKPNTDFFSSLRNYLNRNKYPINLIDKVTVLNSILESKNFALPETHFSLQHGDFFIDNMLVTDKTGELKIIDWGGIRYGPRWVDLAIFMGSSNLPIQDIQQKFLERKSCDYDGIEKVFFIYTLIVSRIVTINKTELDEFIWNFFEPALEYIEKMIFLLDESA